MSIFNAQKITTGDKTVVTFAYNNYRSMIFTNTHATDAVTIDLYVTSQVGGDVTFGYYLVLALRLVVVQV